MKQIVFSGDSDILSDTATEYISPLNILNNSWTSSEVSRIQLVPTNMKIYGLAVKIGNTPGTGTSYTFTIRKNQVDTAQTVTISDLETEAVNFEDEVSFSAGDYISLKCVPSGTPATRLARWTFLVETDSDDEFSFIGGTPNLLPTSVNEYNTPSGGDYWGIEGITSVGKRAYCPLAGTLKNFHMKLSGSPGTGNSYTFRVRKNGTNTSLVISISDGNTSGSDTSNTETISAGDKIDILCAPTSSPTAQYGAWGLGFALDDQTTFPICAVSRNPLNSTATEYNNITSTEEAWSANENNVKVITHSCRMSKFYVELDASPGSGKSYTFTIMKNGSATPLSTTISDTSKTGSDTSNEVEFDLYDTVSIRSVPSGSPSAVEARWGLVVDPVLTDRKSLKLTGIGL